MASIETQFELSLKLCNESSHKWPLPQATLLHYCELPAGQVLSKHFNKSIHFLINLESYN